MKRLKDKEDFEFIEAKLNGEKNGKEKVARELHDKVTPTVIAIKRELEIGERNIKDVKITLSSLHNSIKIVDDVYERLRNLVYDLTPNPLEWLEDIKTRYSSTEGRWRHRIRSNYLWNSR